MTSKSDKMYAESDAPTEVVTPDMDGGVIKETALGMNIELTSPIKGKEVELDTV